MRIRYIVKIALPFVVACALPVLCQAQDGNKKDWDGELKDVKIVISTEREITLPRANRNFEKVPAHPSEPITPPITYDFKVFDFSAPEVKPKIRPLKLKKPEKEDLYNTYLIAGYGNYGSPYLEGFVNSGEKRNQSLGAHAWYIQSFRGPVDNGNSGNGNAGAHVYGKTIGKVLALSGRLGFERTNTHFYGYSPGLEVKRDTIKQIYNEFSMGGTLSNTKNTDFSYDLGVDFSVLGDKFDAKESMVDLVFGANYKMGEKNSVRLDADYSMISRKDVLVDAKPRNLFTAMAYYEFLPMDGLALKIGLAGAYEDDTLGNHDFHVYPNIIGTYMLSPSVDVLASLTGGMEKVSLHSLYKENNWVAPNIAINHLNKVIEFKVGVNGRIGKKVEAHAGIAIANLKNQHYFINAVTDQSKFEVIYDEEGTKRSSLFGALTYAQSEKAKFSVRGDVFTYTTGSSAVTEAWHLPLYKVTLNGYFNVYDKILLSTDLITQGGMKGFDPATSTTLNLENAFDLNARVEYLFSQSFSFFAQFNNITASQYPVFLKYPVRGFQVLGGVTWSF